MTSNKAKKCVKYNKVSMDIVERVICQYCNGEGTRPLRVSNDEFEDVVCEKCSGYGRLYKITAYYDGRLA